MPSHNTRPMVKSSLQPGRTGTGSVMCLTLFLADTLWFFPEANCALSIRPAVLSSGHLCFVGAQTSSAFHTCQSLMNAVSCDCKEWNCCRKVWLPSFIKQNTEEQSLLREITNYKAERLLKDAVSGTCSVSFG